MKRFKPTRFPNPLSPTAEQLGKLKKMLPALKADTAKKLEERARIKKMGKAMACEICMSMFDAALKSMLHPELCPQCNKRLLDGETCFVGIDGQYVFKMGNSDPETLQYRGQVVSVKMKTIIKMKEQYEQAQAQGTKDNPSSN